MKTVQFGEYKISAWAEALAGSWQGMAAITPSIPHTWSGGPTNESFVVEGVHASQVAAEEAALTKATEVLAIFLGTSLMGWMPTTPSGKDDGSVE